MPTLLLLRHGKSDWASGQGGDHLRELAKRGRKAARLAGQVLAANEEVPELVLSSTAVRARTTAELAREAGAWNTRVELEPRLYEASAEGALEVVRSIGAEPSVERLLVVGHEPWLSGLVQRLTGGRVSMVTGALACIDLEASSWREADMGRLRWLLAPRVVEVLR